jgi:hypothetical protein
MFVWLAPAILWVRTLYSQWLKLGWLLTARATQVAVMLVMKLTE